MSGDASISCRHAFSDELLSCARKDSSIYAVTTDARGSVTLGRFANELPDQFVELGIAEQNAVGVAVGLSRSGKRPFVCGPASFYSARSFEQVKNDVAYARANVKVIGVSGGVSYGALGSTHHSLHDIAAFRAVPELSIVLPCDASQTRRATTFLASHDGPVYLRIGRAAVPDVYGPGDNCFVFGRANELADGTDCAIVATGEALFHAIAASRSLETKGIRCTVLDVPTIKPLDDAAILLAARRTGAVVTVEEHSVHGGLGAAVAELLSQRYPVRMRIIGFPDEYPPAGSSPELFDYYGLTERGIAESVVSLISDPGRVSSGSSGGLLADDRANFRESPLRGGKNE